MQRNPLTWLCAIAAVGIATSVLAQPIVPAPAFSGKQLTALPAGYWITNGGNTFNQRYSTLTQINRFNVKDLKAVWLLSAIAPNYLPRGY